MTGGLGFLLNGNMLVGVSKNSLIVRVGPDGYDDALLEPHTKEFDITGKPMRRLSYDAKCVEVIDSFGNRIRFNEDLKKAKA